MFDASLLILNTVCVVEYANAMIQWIRVFPLEAKEEAEKLFRLCAREAGFSDEAINQGIAVGVLHGDGVQFFLEKGAKS